MADPHVHVQTEHPPSLTPLLDSNHNSIPRPNQRREEVTDLDRTLQRLDRFLSLIGFNQSSVWSFTLSFFAFISIGVVLPIVILELSDCPECEKGQIKNFELDIVASQACLAAVSLLCISHNLRKYGIDRFLFVDRINCQVARFQRQYIKQIKGSIGLLILWSLPCFLLKVAREVIRILYVRQESWWLSVAILLALVISWTYLSTISLTASVLFHIVCNLQVIHFDDYAKLLQSESDVLVLIDEHIRLRYHLSKISHRFRIYLILYFVVVTASQVVSLFQTTAYSGKISIINGGDFAVSSIVQVVGIILSLHAATKISHRAQNIGSLASRWHAVATCSSGDSSRMQHSTSLGNLLPNNSSNSLQITYSESDLESLDYLSMPNSRLASFVSSYHKRQSFVMYLQSNPGGITIFGWTVDRALINTIFFIELTLVTFVLGKTIISK